MDATIQKNSFRIKPAMGLLALFVGVARAAIEGPTIADNDYRLAFSPTVAVGSARKVAMGGAYVGIAEGVDSLWDNPVAAAYRPRGSEGRWDYDVALGSVLLSGDDIDNNGQRARDGHRNRLVNVGAMIQGGRWGAGFFAVTQQYDVAGPAGTQRFTFNVGMIALGASSRSGTFFWGVGLRPAALEGEPREGGARTLRLTGSGLALGALWNPGRGPLTLGASYAAPISDDNRFTEGATAPVTVNGLIIPREVALPALGSLGVSYSFERGSFWSRRPLLIGAQISALGSLKNAVGIESFLEQRSQPTGRRTDFSAHLGAEEEIWPGRLRLRAGTYFEPSRFSGVKGRPHATAGFEVRVAKFRLLGFNEQLAVSYALDAARRYFTHFLSVGFWHF